MQNPTKHDPTLQTNTNTTPVHSARLSDDENCQLQSEPLHDSLYSPSALNAASAELQTLFPSANRPSQSASPRTVTAGPHGIGSVPDVVPPNVLAKGHTSNVLKEEAKAALNRPHSPLKRPASELDDDDDRGSYIGDEDGQAAKRASNGRSRDFDGDIEMESRAGDTPAPVLKEEEMPDAQVTTAEGSPKQVPTIDEQVAEITVDKLRTLQEGEDVYIVSMAWLKRLFAKATDSDIKLSKEEEAVPLGPIDNSDIVETPAQNDLLQPQSHNLNTAQVFTSIFHSSGKSGAKAKANGTPATEDENGEPLFFPLKPGSLGEEFESLSKEMWNKLMSWYGLAKGSPIIKRRVVNSVVAGDDEESAFAPQNLIIELNPPIFHIHILRGPSFALTHKSLAKSAAPQIVASKADVFQTFLKKAKKVAGVETSVVRVWKYSPPAKKETSRSRSPSPMFNRKKDKGSDAIKMDIDMNKFLETEGERELVSAKDQTLNENYNGSMTVEMAGLGLGGHLILEEQLEGSWESEKTVKAVSKNGLTSTIKKATKDLIKKSTPTSSRSTSPSRSVGVMTRGREKKIGGRPVGKCGLHNLGNTCYMNSALQCLRNVEELSRYFLSLSYKRELNPSNPLAHGGKVAQSYANLLAHIFSPSAPASYSPIEFKSTIGRFGPSFSGYGQQDSQEFLAFLLDGLHEDLNRIHKKPYIEKPESTDDMVGDENKIRELADKCWDIYKKRNDSAVADLFGGLYKSTLVCPQCDKVSITFDPFMDLTLPLPVDNIWTHEVTLVRHRARPVRFDVELDKSKTMGDLREHIGKRWGIPKERIIGSEIYSHKFFKHFEDGKLISEEIGAKDIAVFYELEEAPFNYPIKKMARIYDEPPNPADDESLAIPVFTVLKGKSSAQSGFRGLPFYISLTPNEAKDYDLIIKKVAEGYQAWTNRLLFDEDGDDEKEAKSGDASENAEMTDGDVIDAADCDSETVKESESEEGYVNVRLGGKATKQPTFKKLHPDFESLIDIRIARGKANLIPTAWNLNSSDSSDKLKNRLRPPVYVKPKSLLPSLRALTPEPDSDDDNLVPDDGPGTPEMQDISDNDNDATTSTNTDPLSFMDTSTSSEVLVEKPTPEKTPEVEPKSDNISKEPLVRPGEGLICDWLPENYDSIFGGKSTDDVRGYSYWELDRIPKQDDQTIAENRRNREERRKRGIKLDDCLDEFAKEEILSAEDPWYCPRCKEHRRASKTFELWKCPDILVIHLKRFSSSRSFRDKIDVLIDFPLTGLDLTKRVGEKKEGESLLYDLFAVDNHYGGLGGGHYTAHAVNFEDGKWYTFDDSSANEIGNPQKVVTPAAYLLFYRRRSDNALGGPVFEDILKSHRETSEAADIKPSTTTTTITTISPASSTRSSVDSTRVANIDLDGDISIDPDLEDDSDTAMNRTGPLSMPFAGARTSSTLFGNNPPPYSPTAADNEVSMHPSVNFSFGPRYAVGEGSTDGDDLMNDVDEVGEGPSGITRQVAAGEDDDEVDDIRGLV